MQIQIFQIDSDYDGDSLKFRGLEQTMELRGGAGIDSGIYEEVFRGDVNCRDLEEVYSLFNVGGHPLHRGHSLSISDVVLTENGAFFCDHWGFKKLDFDPELAHKPDDLLRIVYVEPGRPLFVSEVGRDLLSSGKGVPTEYGLLFENEEVPFQQVYDGTTFPLYCYKGNEVAIVHMHYQGRTEYLYLPEEHNDFIFAVVCEELGLL